jgi:hypothetical protein
VRGAFRAGGDTISCAIWERVLRRTNNAVKTLYTARLRSILSFLSSNFSAIKFRLDPRASVGEAACARRERALHEGNMACRMH